MGRFVRNIVIQKEFDGDQWRFVLKPLTHADAVALLASVQSGDNSETYRQATEMLPRYIEEATGGTDAAGSPLTAADVCTLAYFAPLVSEVTEAWMAQSMPGNFKPSGA